VLVDQGRGGPGVPGGLRAGVDQGGGDRAFQQELELAGERGGLGDVELGDQRGDQVQDSLLVGGGDRR
jgi:hypothetical protein